YPTVYKKRLESVVSDAALRSSPKTTTRVRSNISMPGTIPPTPVNKAGGEALARVPHVIRGEGQTRWEPMAKVNNYPTFLDKQNLLMPALAKQFCRFFSPSHRATRPKRLPWIFKALCGNSNAMAMHSARQNQPRNSIFATAKQLGSNTGRGIPASQPVPLLLDRRKLTLTTS
ncbi:hypothetical protein CCH79_00000122, partial [Gambusia affinis]